MSARFVKPLFQKLTSWKSNWNMGSESKEPVLRSNIFSTTLFPTERIQSANLLHIFTVGFFRPAGSSLVFQFTCQVSVLYLKMPHKRMSLKPHKLLCTELDNQEQNVPSASQKQPNGLSPKCPLSFSILVQKEVDTPLQRLEYAPHIFNERRYPPFCLSDLQLPHRPRAIPSIRPDHLGRYRRTVPAT